jgi:hypothetical protein
MMIFVRESGVDSADSPRDDRVVSVAPDMFWRKVRGLYSIQTNWPSYMAPRFFRFHRLHSILQAQAPKDTVLKSAPSRRLVDLHPQQLYLYEDLHIFQCQIRSLPTIAVSFLFHFISRERCQPMWFQSYQSVGLSATVYYFSPFYLLFGLKLAVGLNI